jgi:hypothetical protein
MNIELKKTPQWRFKKWDFRENGDVFWQYCNKSKNKQRWVTWDMALKYQKNAKQYGKMFCVSQARKDYRKQYRKTQNHKNYQRGYYQSYSKSRRKSDPMFAMACRLRVRISLAVHKKGYLKTSKTSEILGCSWDDFKNHLEARFVDGMSWDNRHLWHIDHIIPLASATSEEELIKLNHYTNLQPLWAEDNLRKGDKILSQV